MWTVYDKNGRPMLVPPVTGIINFTGNVNWTSLLTATTNSSVSLVNFLSNVVVQGLLTANGGLAVNGAVAFGNTTISGWANVANTLQVSGNAHLIGNTTLDGFANIAGTLAVVGNSALGNTNVAGNLVVSGLSTLTGNATLSGFANIAGTLTVVGNTAVGNTNVGGNLVVSGLSTLTGNATLSGFANIAQTLQVAGLSTLTGNAELGGYANIASTLQVTGNTRIDGVLNANGGLVVNGSLTFGNTTIDGLLIANAGLIVNGVANLGVTNIASTLQVSGLSNLVGNVTFGGFANVGTNLRVQGTSILYDLLTANNGATVNGTLSINKYLSANGSTGNTLDLLVSGDAAGNVNWQHYISANQVLMEANAGGPSVYQTSVDKALDTALSSGMWDPTITYVVKNLSNSSFASVNVAGGVGFLRSSNSPLADLVPSVWPASANISIPIPAAGQETQRYIGVEYNSGTPQITTRTSFNWNWYSDFPLGRVSVESDGQATVLNLLAHAEDTADYTRRMLRLCFPFQRETPPEGSGGLVIGETGGGGFLTMSAGNLWHGFNKLTMSAIDTSGADRLDAYWQDGAGGFNVTRGLTQYPNGSYDNGTGSLAALTGTQRAVMWVYLHLDGSLDLVYGRNHYGTDAAAAAEVTPSNVPPHLASEGRLLGSVIFQRAVYPAHVVSSVWTTVFTPSAVVDHNTLSGLQGGTAGEYYHLTNAQYDPFINAAASLAFAGKLVTGNTLIANAGLIVNGTSNLGVTNISSTLQVAGLTTLTGNATLSGFANIATTLQVAGVSTLTGNTTHSGFVNVAQTLQVAGVSTLTGNATLSGFANIAGLSTLTGNATFGGFANIAGAVTGLTMVGTVAVLTDGATVTINSASGDIFTLDMGGDRALAIPTSAQQGHKIILAVHANGAGRTLTLNTSAGGFVFGSDITALTQTASGKTDLIGCIYNLAANAWWVAAYTKGF